VAENKDNLAALIMAGGAAMLYLSPRPFDPTAKGSINRRKPLPTAVVC